MRSKKLSRIALALLSTLVSMATLHALPSSVSGRVLDAEGNPLVGASVSVQGTTATTVTDADGGFRLDVPSGTKALFVSMLGLRDVEIPLVEETTWYDVTIAEDTKTLVESVAIGYGTLDRRDLSTSISTVCGEALNDRASAFNVTQALAGKVAGYSVHNTSGRPGGTNTVYIRGRGNNGVDVTPLYVVDGVAGVDIDMINSADIESVVVLKDAASTAIYGANGANGVVLVTTKSGKDKNGAFTYSGSVGLSQLTHGYKELEHVYENAISHGHNLSFSKANERNTVYASLGYKDFGGIVPKTDADRLNTALNFKSKINDWLDVRFGADFSTRTEMRGDLVFDDLAYKTIVNNTSAGTSGSPDHLATLSGYDYTTMLDKAVYRQKDQQMLLNGAGDIHLAKGLMLTIRGDYRTNNYTFGQSAPGGIEGATVTGNGFANIANSDTHRWSNEDYLTYDKDFGDVKSSSVLGVSFSNLRLENSYSGSTDFSDNQYEFYRMQAGTVYDQSTSGYYNNSTRSVFFRSNWAVSNRYLFGVTLRYDSASIYGYDDMSGIYPALSAGWVISEEPWFDSAKNAVNLFKVRASYGFAGNSAVPMRSVSAGQNSDLKWEEARQLDLGLDLSFWGSRLNLSTDFYMIDTHDPFLKSNLISAVPLYSNLGLIRNSGLDVTLNARPVANSDFQWDATLLYSLNTSKAVEIGGKVDYSMSPVSSVEGEELNTLLNSGGTTPHHEINFVNSFNLKGFTLLVDLMAKAGFWTYCDAWNTKGPFDDKFAFKGNYLRLRNVSLTYDFGRDVLKKDGFFRGMKVGVQAENLFTSTGVPSIDPEDFIWDGKVGVAGGAYPRPRTISGTLKLTF